MQKISINSSRPLPAAVLGGDVSKKSIDFCLLRPAGAEGFTFGGALTSARCKVSNSDEGFKKLDLWLNEQKVSQIHVCLESTGIHSIAPATHLHRRGHVVSVVNPLRTHHYGKSRLSRTKTDKQDADMIAQFCLIEQPVQWHPLPPEILELRDMVRQVASLTETSAEYAIRLQEQKRETVRKTTGNIIKALEQQIAQLAKLIDKHLAAHPKLLETFNLYQTIKGVGRVTALTVMTEMPQMAKFDTAKQAAAFAGVAPQQHESGTSIRGKTSISKIGNSRVRQILYMAALTASRRNPGLKAVAERLQATGKAKKVVLGAIMRKLVHILYGIARTGKPAYPMYAKTS